MSVEAAPKLCLPPKPLTRLPKMTLPAGTVDSHFHVFKPGAPLNSPRSYDPQMLTLADWQDYAAKVGIGAGVLVQPSVYGFDNSVLLDALAADSERLRGIVVLPTDTSATELRQLDEAGVRGVRINTRNKGGLPFDAVTSFAAALADLDWTIQFQVKPDQMPDIIALRGSVPSAIVIDHLGFIPLGTAQTATHVSDLRRLLDQPKCYVKLSAPYRLSRDSRKAFADVAKRLVASHADRLLWGSDWPHTELWDDMPDDTDLIESIADWAPTETIRQAILADNAQSLFFSR